MEASPNPTRQRNRRSERYEQEPVSAPVAPVQAQTPATSSVPMPRALQKEPAPVTRPAAVQQPGAIPVPRALQSSVPAARTQHPPVRTLQQSGDMPVRPVRRTPEYSAQSYPVQRSTAVPQQTQTPAQPAGYPAQAQAPVRRPQQRMMDEPSPTQTAPVTQDADSRKMPRWMTGSLVGMFLLVLSMITAISLMQAYLKTQADKRETAYQAVLNNYHVLAGNDGTMSVTHQDAIEYYAAQNNLQPAFVTAIIRNESSFRRDAESSVGARGLMQLMQDTSEWIAGKLDVDNFHFDMMYDPETNIRFGCWYLGYLSRLFRGDPVLVSAAYHAGQTTVTRWLSDRSISPDGRTIPLERLNDGPTKTYAGRVTQAYGIYQALLYPNQSLQGEVSSVSAADTGVVRTVIER